MTMTKGERTELRSVVRQQFKVLRAEVVQRQKEMTADMVLQIGEHFAADDETWRGVTHRIHEITLAANREVNDALYESGYQAKGNTEQMWFHTPNLHPPTVGDRQQMTMAAHRKIDAQVADALLRLDREEADLLRSLSVGALESAEAHAFLAGIPTVSQLVPSTRLAELEIALGEDGS
jgi:hypothetical protein